MSGLRIGGAILSLAVFAALATPAMAKHPVSSKFDGTYAGAGVKADTTLSTGTCPAVGTASLVVSKGFLKGVPKAGPRVGGVVVSSGFVTGVYRTKGVNAKMQGVVDSEGKMTLGLRSADSKCFWLLELTRK